MGGISILILMSILSFMFFAFVAIFLLIIIYSLIAYIFESISIMRMAQNLKYKMPFVAWVPFYNKYILGKLTGNKILGTIVGLLNIVTVGIGIYCYIQIEINPIMFGIFLICVLVGFILDSVISHKIYINVSKKFGDILTILSVITLGTLRPIFLFVIRNKVQ